MKFECILDDPYRVVLKLEEKLNRFLRPIKEYLGKTTYDFVRASIRFHSRYHVWIS